MAPAPRAAPAKPSDVMQGVLAHAADQLSTWWVHNSEPCLSSFSFLTMFLFHASADQQPAEADRGGLAKALHTAPEA